MARFLLLWGIVSAYQFTLYFGSQFLEGEPRTVGWKLDEKIPVLPGFIYIYCSWFFLLLLVPLALWRCSAAVCVRYLLANAITQSLAFVIFMLWPTTFQRPEPAGRGLTREMFRFIYNANHRFLNCIPSMHCCLSILFALAALSCPGLPFWQLIAIVTLSLLIVLSTVLVKQHMLIDVITAFPCAFICWQLSALPDTERLAGALGL